EKLLNHDRTERVPHDAARADPEELHQASRVPHHVGESEALLAPVARRHSPAVNGDHAVARPPQRRYLMGPPDPAPRTRPGDHHDRLAGSVLLEAQVDSIDP